MWDTRCCGTIWTYVHMALRGSFCNTVFVSMVNVVDNRMAYSEHTTFVRIRIHTAPASSVGKNAIVKQKTVHGCVAMRAVTK